jgi:3-dehydroquinate synthase
VSVVKNRGKSRVRWQTIPLAVLVVVLVSYVALEFSGVVSFTDTLDRLRESSPLVVAATIFALLVVDSVLPVPSTPLIALAGSVFGVAVGAALTIAGSMGCSAASYAVGRFASPLLRHRIVDDDELREMQQWGDRFGRWMFVLSRGLPLMTETVGTSAGIARVPFGRFLGYTLLGTAPVCLIYVVAGSYADTAKDILAIAALGFLVPVALWYAVRRVLRRKRRTPARAEPDQG